MKRLFHSISIMTAIFTSSVHADLPVIPGDEWRGYFTATKNRKAFFAIGRNTESIFHILDRKGNFLRASNPVKVKFQVFEVNADGNFIRKTIDTSSLTTDAKPTANPRDPITISGKVTNNATYETTIKIEPVAFVASGKITNPGDMKSPLHFGIGIDLDPYKNIDFTGGKKSKQFEKLARRDRLEMITLTGEKKTYKLNEEANFPKDFPDGISSITISTHRYEDVEYILTASKGSAIHFSYKNPAPAYKQLKLLWKANDGSDPSAETLTMRAE